MSKAHTNNGPWLICLENDGYEASLERAKVYRTIADPNAASEGLVRIIDESGEDYLYPARFFESIQLPVNIRRSLAGARGRKRTRSTIRPKR
jgi:hypothetical protein